MWLNLVGDVKSLTKDVGDQIIAENKPPEKQVYMSLPRPGVSNSSNVFHADEKEVRSCIRDPIPGSKMVFCSILVPRF